MPHRTFLGWFILVWLIGLAIFGGFVFTSWSAAVEADSWPKTTAKITTSQLIQRSGRRSPRYTADLAYSYTVGTSTHRSSSVSAFSVGPSPNARDLIASYPLGADVPVAVNPLNPEEAYLQTGFRWSFVALALINIPLLCVAALVWACRSRTLDPGSGYIGSYIVHTTPLPRLVTLRFGAPAFGWVWASFAGGACWIIMFITGGMVPSWDGSGLIPPSTNPGAGDFPVMAPILLITTAVVGCGALLWRRHQLAACEHELVIDAAQGLLFTAKSLGTGRQALSLLEISHFTCTQTERRVGTKKQVLFRIHPVDMAGTERPKILNVSDVLEGMAVVAWLNEAMGKPPTDPSLDEEEEQDGLTDDDD